MGILLDKLCEARSRARLCRVTKRHLEDLPVLAVPVVVVGGAVDQLAGPVSNVRGLVVGDVVVQDRDDGKLQGNG